MKILVGSISNKLEIVRKKKYYRDQINLSVNNKVVIDLGAGSGILSFMCILAGAKKVFAIEKNKIVCMMLKKSINTLGWQDKIVVLNKDFIFDDISEYLESAEVCVSEIINNSFTNNIAPYMLHNIKEKYQHLKIVPEIFNYQVKVIENTYLSDYINWGYDPNLNKLFDDIYLDFTIYRPLKLFESYPEHKHKTITTTNAIEYNFKSNTVTDNIVHLPKDKTNKWLEINWHFDGQIYSDYWQREFIPLSINRFEKVNSISLIPHDYVHKIKINAS